MNDIIVFEQLTKHYKNHQALNGISFSIAEGDIFGFVGPNGAGKTTTIRILTTLLKPTSGRILVAGQDVVQDRYQVRQKIGYVPDFFGTYHDMTSYEYLDFFAGCYHISKKDRPHLIADLLALVDLEHRRHDFVESLSRGMKQRLGLARALIHDPQILVLDEPASGLDPRARVEFRALLKELQKMGKTILFSSHILADVDELCTNVGIIEAGEMVACGPLQALRSELQSQRTIYITILGDEVWQTIDEAQLALSYVSEVTDLTYIRNADNDWVLQFHFQGDKQAVSNLIRRLVQANIPLLSFREEGGSLEDLFITLTEGIVS